MAKVEMKIPSINVLTHQTTKQRFALNVSGIDDNDIALALSLLKRVCEKNEQPFFRGRFLEPTVMRAIGKHNQSDEDKEDKCAIFFSFPYLSVEVAKKIQFSDDLSLHPTRSLFQTNYHLESTEGRDLQQVVRKDPQYPKGSLIYVPQLWCLILNSRK